MKRAQNISSSMAYISSLSACTGLEVDVSVSVFGCEVGGVVLVDAAIVPKDSAILFNGARKSGIRITAIKSAKTQKALLCVKRAKIHSTEMS